MVHASMHRGAPGIVSKLVVPIVALWLQSVAYSNERYTTNLRARTRVECDNHLVQELYIECIGREIEYGLKRMYVTRILIEHI